MSERTPVRISIVIPTRNRRELLRATLETLERQRFPKEAYEALVVVDGGTDGTAEMLRVLRPPFALHLLIQPHRGPGAARNAGIAAASGDLVLLLDDDLECEPDLLAAHVRAHERAAAEGEGPWAVFGPVLVSPQSPSTLATDWVRRYTDAYVRRLEREGPRWPDDAITDANTSIRRSVLLESGGFDERFLFSRETAELGLRLWKRGVRFRYAPEAAVRHVFVKSAGQVSGADAEWFGRNEVLVCLAHPEVRPHSALAALCHPAPAARLRFHAAAAAPGMDGALGAVQGLAERSRLRPFQEIGIRALQLRHAVSALRGALRQMGSTNALTRELGVGLPVLVYHHVGSPVAGTFPELTVSPRRLERHLRLLSAWGCSPISVAQWVSWCREGAALPPKPVLLTFDDAYAGVATHAVPLLEHFGFCATLFAVSDRLDGTNTWDAAHGSATLQLMGAAALRDWAARGWEIGAHSRTHARLTSLSGAALEAEVRASGDALARTIGQPIRAYAYPYGTYSEAAVALAGARYDAAFTTDEGLNGLTTPLHRLRRTMVQPSDTAVDLWFRVTLGWSPLARLCAVYGALLGVTR